MTRLRSAWLACRMLSWIVALRLLKRAVPLRGLVAFVRPRGTRFVAAHDAVPERIVALAQTATACVTRHPETACLVRSLVAYRYLARAGFDPKLEIGFARDDATFAHAWIELHGRPLSDTPADLARFAPVVAFASDGRAMPH